MHAGIHPTYSFHTAKRIITGVNALDTIDASIGEIGKFRSAWILTQPSIVKNGTIDRLVRRLESAGIACDVNTDVQPEPTVRNLNEVRQSLHRDYDLYIGIGGGSVLDAVKIFSVLRTNAMTIHQMIGTNQVVHPGLPTVLIPTTSGTGSEVTPNAIVTLPEEELKVGIVSRHLLPDLVILDPALTLGLPPSITAATGMDAFTHALESFISNKANPLSDLFALESIRRISRSILTAYREGGALWAREDMLLGSMLGGMALTGAGTAAVHAMAYPLGGKFNIPHGVANSMLLPHVMAFNQDAIADRLHEVAEAMNIPSEPRRSASQTAELVIARISELTQALNIPQDLRPFGVEVHHIPVLAEAAAKVTRLLNNNPKPISTSDMENIYHKLWV